MGIRAESLKKGGPEVQRWSESLFLTPAPVPKKVASAPAPAPELIVSLHSDSCLHSETPTPACTLESRVYFAT